MLTIAQVAHREAKVERFELSDLDIDADVIRDSLSRVGPLSGLSHFVP